eukprot:1076025-Rhodomonas_salina.1
MQIENVGFCRGIENYASRVALVHAVGLDGQQRFYSLSTLSTDTSGFAAPLAGALHCRHLAGRKAGEPPDCLVDYFPLDDWLLLVDESHISVPQVRRPFALDCIQRVIALAYETSESEMLVFVHCRCWRQPTFDHGAADDGGPGARHVLRRQDA